MTVMPPRSSPQTQDVPLPLLEESFENKDPIRPVLIENLFQLHENSHDRRGRAASHHYLIIYDI